MDSSPHLRYRRPRGTATDLVNISVFMFPDTKEKLRKLSDRMELSQAAVVETLLDRCLEDPTALPYWWDSSLRREAPTGSAPLARQVVHRVGLTARQRLVAAAQTTGIKRSAFLDLFIAQLPLDLHGYPVDWNRVPGQGDSSSGQQMLDLTSDQEDESSHQLRLVG